MDGFVSNIIVQHSKINQLHIIFFNIIIQNSKLYYRRACQIVSILLVVETNKSFFVNCLYADRVRFYMLIIKKKRNLMRQELKNKNSGPKYENMFDKNQ